MHTHPEFATREVGPRDARRTLAAVAEEEGLVVAQAEVQVDYAYWPVHEVLQVRDGGWMGAWVNPAGAGGCP